jgi:uncharacterized glyoxalase superfamily protein PhnB
MSLEAIGIISQDLQKSKAFYQLFNIEFQEIGGPEHLEGQAASGLRLMLDSVELVQKINPGGPKLTGSGIVLCFKQSGSEEVDRLYQKVISEGYEGIKAPCDAFWGQRYASVSDPDGNQVDIFAELT